MDLNNIVQRVSRRIYKYVGERKGWKTNRKILVIESDDWGSIRMPNREIYNAILESGIRVDLSHYNKYDTLASVEDFGHMFDTLLKHKDKNGNPPIITANTIVANPDFERIKESSFKKYFYESFLITLDKYQNKSFDLWLEGIANNVFYPQLHGREHLNVGKWMKYLQASAKEVHFAFDHGLFGIGPKISLEGNPTFVQAFDSEEYFKEHTLERILRDGFSLFEEIFGFRSKSFIAPNYHWDDKVENCLNELGVQYLQGMVMQVKPDGSRKYNYTGKQNKNNQIYLTRNVFFEPSSNEKKDWVTSALKEIDRSFKLGKPAIVSMHRVNFIGEIFEHNRQRSLKLLDELLTEVEKRWPDIEYFNSETLGDLIRGDFMD